ncbi:MAG: hypothetical protein AABY87_12875 [bacterium]
MAETKTLTFTHKEVVEALIKQQDIHEGIWQLYVEFGIAGANISTGEDQLSPSAIVPINKIGLHRVDKENPLAIDASIVNPQ